MQSPKLGKVITERAGRDAVHIAVAPVIAAEQLLPGVRIDFISGSDTYVMRSHMPIGIVDPYLSTYVEKDQRFWMFLLPDMITSLQHKWTHPAFSDEEVTGETVKPVPTVKPAPTESERVKAEMIINALALDAGFTFEKMMKATEDFLNYGEVVIDGGKYEGLYANDKFWDAYEVVTGRTVNAKERGGIFSCSC